jgi:hypothetical protein
MTFIIFGPKYKYEYVMLLPGALQYLLSWIVFYDLHYLWHSVRILYVMILHGSLQHLMSWIVFYDLHYLWP